MNPAPIARVVTLLLATLMGVGSVSLVDIIKEETTPPPLPLIPRAR